MSRSFFRRLRRSCAVAALLCCAGCAADHVYELDSNWVVKDNAIPAYFLEYDVLFFYPTQVEHADGGVLNWMQGKIAEELQRYVKNHASDLFQKRARVFSPFLPQLGFDRYDELVAACREDPECRQDRKSPLAPAIDHAAQALQYYMAHFHGDSGRPFILIGQEQGALILYEAMKRCSDIRPDNGFIAAYFQGLPLADEARIRRDFGSRGIVPAQGARDLGVIAVWNTECPGAASGASLARNGNCVINPLNWRTDAEPAEPERNPESVFYNVLEKRLALRRAVTPHFCGAAADPERGVLILTRLPAAAPAPAALGERMFPSMAWGIFAGALRRNADERVAEYLFQRRGMRGIPVR